MTAISASHSRAADFDQRVEHGLQIEGRAADDLEHVGGRGLLLQRFAQLVEQSRVLDGDDGLGGEIRDQLNLFVAERSHFLAVDDRWAPTSSLSLSIGTASTVRAPQSWRSAFGSSVVHVDKSLLCPVCRRYMIAALCGAIDQAR